MSRGRNGPLKLPAERRTPGPAPPLSMGDALAASTGRSGGARGRFPGAARAQAAPLHEPERRQAPPFGGMSGGRAFQIGPAHEGGGPGRGNPPDVEVFRLGNSGTIVSLWHFCISFSDAYTEGRGVTAWRRSRPAAQRAPTRRSESRTAELSDTSFAFWCLGGIVRAYSSSPQTGQCFR